MRLGVEVATQYYTQRFFFITVPRLKDVWSGFQKAKDELPLLLVLYAFLKVVHFHLRRGF